MIRHPDGGSGRCDFFVQPQDVFATILGFAGLAAPSSLDVRDVRSLAERGKGSSRRIALSGPAADPAWKDGKRFFTVFDEEQYLLFDPKPEGCRLVRYGTQEDIAASHQGEVERLHGLGIDELERRGADHRLIGWLRRRGEGPFPDDCLFWDGYPGPAGYRTYFTRNYRGD